MASMGYSLHKQQLFHWVGRNVEQDKGLSREAKADWYRDALRGSLVNGLWVKSPETPEVLKFKGMTHANQLPMVCFTEWSLGQSSGHTKKYGCMGLGFPRRWVLKKHGQPVTYCRTDNHSTFIKTLFELVNARCELNEKAAQSLDYLLHFTKPARIPAERNERSKATSKSPSKTMRKPRQSNPHRRSYGAPMRYIEEREWRIVRSTGSRGFSKNKNGEGPPFYLNYKPGKELFTLVLPDNYTVSRVMNCPTISKALFPDNAPHVAILSLEDVGTF